jgi:CelD/BcsL family acetyltransferase involved in cellulose biosynthesis
MTLLDAPPPAPLAGDASSPPLAAASRVAEWRPLAALAAIEAPWRALAARAAEPNVFYEPAFALAAAPVFGRDAGAVLVWNDWTKRRLLGLFPARVAGWRSGFPLPVTLGWTHPYAPLGAPLVDRDAAAGTVGAWLDFLARGDLLPRRLLLPFVPTDGAFAAAFGEALAARGLASLRFATHARALLAPEADRAGYLERGLSAKKRKELARQRRRLTGEATAIVSAPEEVAAALADFMALEQSGWKGRAGTAAVQDAAAARFMCMAVTRLAASGQARVARLAADGRTVAAGILLQSGDTGWFWKIAYDEAAARNSPGVQLALDLTRAALADATLARVDSCASAGHSMIEPLWRERLILADHLVALDGANRLAGTAETLRRRAVVFARGLRDRLRGPAKGRRVTPARAAAAG